MISSKKLYVLKSNKIIEAQYKLSAREQKFILYMASKIRADDTEFEFYEVKVSEIASVLNISGKKQGNIHQEIYEMCHSFNKKPIKIEGPNGRMQLINWVSSADFQPDRGIITFEFSKRLKPLLLNLKAHFTKYSLEFVMQLSSAYSIRFYEILKRHSFKTPPKFTITLEELKTILDIQDSYKEYRYFKKRVLNVAQEELDKKADIGFTYEEHRMKRKVVSLTFYIHSNEREDIKDLPPVEVQQTLFNDKENAPQHPIVSKLIALGFKTDEAQELFDQGFELIENAEQKELIKKEYITVEAYFQAKLDMLNSEHSKKPKKNPRGFLIQSLKMNYKNEQVEKEHTDKKQKAQIVKEKNKLKGMIKAIKEEYEELTALIERSEESTVSQLLSSSPTLLEETAIKIKVKEYFLYDSTISLKENYEKKPSIQAMINAKLKEEFPERVTGKHQNERIRLSQLSQKLQELEAQLKQLK